MTVSELIEKLEKLPQDAEVRRLDEGGYPEPAERVELTPYDGFGEFVLIT